MRLYGEEAGNPLQERLKRTIGVCFQGLGKLA